MRIPKMISPSSLGKFEKDRDDFYMKYCAEPKIPREAQSAPASVGSGFDAYVKAHLMADVLGLNFQEEFDALFYKQVEEGNQEFANKAGLHCYNCYVHSGSYDELREDLEKAQVAPQFEFDAAVEVGGVPLFGKPDARYVDQYGNHIILDWKVNGYCGNYNTSPNKGYALCRDGIGYDKPSRNNGKSHKLYEPFEFNNVTINKHCLESFSIDWADQLTMYGWMMGEQPGDEIIVRIDQLVAKPNGDRPAMRVANHIARVSKHYQENLVSRLQRMWGAITTGHVFLEVSKEENDKLCVKFDRMAALSQSDGSKRGDFLAACFRGTSNYRAR